MFWTTSSSPSTRPVRKRCASAEDRSSRPRSTTIAAAICFAGLLFGATQAPALAARSQDNEKPPATAVQPFGVFGSLELRTNATTGLTEWRRFSRESAANLAMYVACEVDAGKCPKQFLAWRRELLRWRTMPELIQIKAVNSWMNTHIRYADDRKLFGVDDKWLTLASSLKGRGDCEDYALAKYETLKVLGMSEDKLRIVIVKDTRKGIGHAILTVSLDGALFVLDNQNRQVLRHEAVSYYSPVYSVNGTGRWINIATRKIKTRYDVALERGSDPAVETHPLPATKTAVADAPVLHPTLIDYDVAPAADAVILDPVRLGNAAREPSPVF